MSVEEGKSLRFAVFSRSLASLMSVSLGDEATKDERRARGKEREREDKGRKKILYYILLRTFTILLLQYYCKYVIKGDSLGGARTVAISTRNGINCDK